jgi:hypothetical protein
LVISIFLFLRPFAFLAPHLLPARETIPEYVFHNSIYFLGIDKKENTPVTKQSVMRMIFEVPTSKPKSIRNGLMMKNEGIRNNIPTMKYPGVAPQSGAIGREMR